MKKNSKWGVVGHYVKGVPLALIVFCITWAIQYALPILPFVECLRSFARELISFAHELLLNAMSHPDIAKFIVAAFFAIVSKIAQNVILELRSKKQIKTRMLEHFSHSYGIVKNEMIPAMEELASKNTPIKNREMDSYIQSPIEYVNETVKGNQVPTFDPDDTYQDVLYEEDIKFIVAITAENPNFFLDPTIGFYMSNCYAASIIKHTNEFLENFESATNQKPKMCVMDLNELEEVIDEKRQDVLNKLKNEEKFENFEFIRIFMYDKHQRECCDNAVFPSLKASQDLFRTLSFYIQKEKLKNSLSLNCKWDEFNDANKVLWQLYDTFCETRPTARKVQNDRINNTVPEFLFVFYEDKIGIHTYLGGEYSRKTVKTESNVGDSIRSLIKILADYVDKDSEKGKIEVGDQLNSRNTFIDWIWTPKVS